MQKQTLRWKRKRKRKLCHGERVEAEVEAEAFLFKMVEAEAEAKLFEMVEMEAEAEAVFFQMGLLEAEAEAVQKSTASASLVVSVEKSVLSNQREAHGDAERHIFLQQKSIEYRPSSQ